MMAQALPLPSLPGSRSASFCVCPILSIRRWAFSLSMGFAAKRGKWLQAVSSFILGQSPPKIPGEGSHWPGMSQCQSWVERGSMHQNCLEQMPRRSPKGGGCFYHNSGGAHRTDHHCLPETTRPNSCPGNHTWPRAP